jgi:hypothetical protein
MFIANVYESPGATWLPGVAISWSVGLVAAGGIHFISTRNLDRASEAPAAARSDQELRRGDLLQ